MSATQTPSDGGKTLFWMSALILGGLLFAAGVMVGRATAPDAEPQTADPLARLDERDRGAVADEQALTFPKALSDPPAEPQPTVVPDAGRPEPAAVAAGEPEQKPEVDDGPDDGADDGADEAAAADFTVQLASFRRADQAAGLVEQLRQSGLVEVRVVSGEVEGQGTYYRVRVGHFAERQQAELFMVQNGFDGLVIRSTD